MDENIRSRIHRKQSTDTETFIADAHEKSHMHSDQPFN